MKKREFLSMVAASLMALFMILPAAAKPGKEKKKAVFSVELDCKKCVEKIERNIPFEKGVSDMKIDQEKQTVTITYRQDKTDPEKLVAAFEKIGLKATEITEDNSEQETTSLSVCQDENGETKE